MAQKKWSSVVKIYFYRVTLDPIDSYEHYLNSFYMKINFFSQHLIPICRFNHSQNS